MIKQIVYNVEDYAGSGGLISSNSQGDKVYPNDYYDENGESKIDIYNEIFSQIGIVSVNKIGIQAPPGTRFWLNLDSPPQQNSDTPDVTIMVGRTGIYETEPGFKINGLQFERPVKYVLDTMQSKDMADEGRRDMDEAKITFDQNLAALKNKYGSATSSASNKDFWEEYEILHNNYVKAYEKGRSRYISGMMGIYVKIEANSENEINDLRNIIIDIRYDSPSQEAN